jgi:hypothetical protein
VWRAGEKGVGERYLGYVSVGLLGGDGGVAR